MITYRRIAHIINQRLLSYFEFFPPPPINKSLKFPPIFIIGAPRSGSTLLMQVLVDAFDVGYLSNLHCYFFGAPALIERLFRPTAKRRESDFLSEYGATKGWLSPAECGDYWYRFFRRKPTYVRLVDVEYNKMRCLRKSIAALIESFNKPILFKNLFVSLRIQPLARCFPESLFIIIKRDELANAQSLLAARNDIFGNYNQWFSIEPPEIETLLLLPPAQQVVEQIRHVHKIIQRDLKLAQIDSSRIFSVRYEDFCHDVKKHISKFDDFFMSNGITLQRRHEVPKSFQISTKRKIPDSLFSDLNKYINCQ